MHRLISIPQAKAAMKMVSSQGVYLQCNSYLTTHVCAKKAMTRLQRGMVLIVKKWTLPYYAQHHRRGHFDDRDDMAICT